MEAQRTQRPTWLFQSALAAVLWVTLWALSMLMTLAPYESVWFPASGITFLAMLLSGYRAMPGIAIAILVTTFWGDLLFGLQVPYNELLKGTSYFLMMHIAIYWLYAKLFMVFANHYIVLRKQNSALTLVIAFIGLALASSLTNAWLGIEVLVQTGMIKAAQQQALFWSWGFGDAAGLLVVAPIGLGIAGIVNPKIRKYLGSMSFQNHPADKGPVLTKTSATLLTLIAVLTLNLHNNSAGIAALIFITLIPLIWIVLTESPTIAAATLAGLSFLTALFIDGFGFLVHELIYQSAIITMAVSTWLIIAIRTSAEPKNGST